MHVHTYMHTRTEPLIFNVGLEFEGVSIDFECNFMHF